MSLHDDLATDTLVITRPGVRRICEYAFGLAQTRRRMNAAAIRQVTCVDKANIFKSYAFFRKVFDEVAKTHPNIRSSHAYIDAQRFIWFSGPSSSMFW